MQNVDLLDRGADDVPRGKFHTHLHLAGLRELECLLLRQREAELPVLVFDFAGVFLLQVQKRDLDGLDIVDLERFAVVRDGNIDVIGITLNHRMHLLISALNTIHFEVPDWVPLIGGRSFGISIPLVSNVALPRLAQGAVIPPNREFLAVLGDQKSGTNIETPLATMVQAFKQAMNETGGMGGRSITVVMQVDKREFARAVYQANNDETQRVGVRLAGVRT